MYAYKTIRKKKKKLGRSAILHDIRRKISFYLKKSLRLMKCVLIFFSYLWFVDHTKVSQYLIYARYKIKKRTTVCVCARVVIDRSVQSHEETKLLRITKNFSISLHLEPRYTRTICTSSWRANTFDRELGVVREIQLADECGHRTR